MKAIIILILGSLSLAAGGVVTMHLNDINVVSVEMWRFAFESMATIPGAVVDGAISSEQEVLFRGVLVTVSGIVIAALLSFTAIVVSLVKALGVRRKMRSRSGSPKKSGQESGATRREVVSEPAAARRPNRIREKIAEIVKAIKAKKESRKAVFEDADAVLEEEEEIKKPTLFEKLNLKIRGAASKKNTLVIKSGKDTEAVVEVQDESGFCDDLREWYGSIRNVPHNDPEKIEEARSLASRASRRARAKVTDDDAMNGEFMLRMMDAWANKKEGSSRSDTIPIVMSDMEDDSQEKATFSRAIKDVIEEGYSSDEEEDEFAIDGVDDEDDDFIIQDIDEESDVETFAEPEEGEDEFALPHEVEVEEVASSHEASAAVHHDGELTAIKTARFIIEFEEKAKLVANFEDEWDEEFAEASARRAHVEEMFETLGEQLESQAEEIQNLSPFDAEDDAREVDWLQQNMGQLDEIKESLLSTDSEEADGANSGDVDDLEEEFGIVTSSAPTVAEDEETTDFDDEIDGVSMMIGDTDEGVADAEDEVNDASTDALKEELQEEQVGEVEVAPSHEPRDVSLGELDEIEKSDELIYNWALVAKSAGAAEAKISHSVIAKDGLRRRVIGITHLVAAWRRQEKDDSRRLNLLLRYIPEGDWKLDMEDHEKSGIRMVDTLGDFVQVSPDMIGQPEIKNGILLVHFYGPGAPRDVLIEKDNVIVTTATLSVDKLRDKMVG